MTRSPPGRAGNRNRLRHFPNKEALFEAIVLDQLERFVDERDDTLRDAKDPGQAFVDFLKKYSAVGPPRRTSWRRCPGGAST